MAVDKYNCRKCHKNIAATGQSPSPFRYRKHDLQRGEECPNSRTIIPAWIVQRGPEPEDTDVPVIGRDYAPCPECKRSPLLDDEGKFNLHIREPGVPSAERVDCPMSGQPYTPEGEECTTAPSTPEPEASADTAPAALSTPQTSRPDSNAPPSPKAAPATAAPPETPAADTSATTGRSTDAPTEAEQMLSTWAAQTREIEDRKLPETEPSPASTPTPQALPSRPDAPEAPPQSHASGPTPSAPTAPASTATDAPRDASPAPGSERRCHITTEHPSHEWMQNRQVFNCGATATADAVAPAGAPLEPLSSAADAAAAEAASTSTVPTGGPPPDVQALAKLFPRSARTPGSISTGSAVPAPAAAPATGAVLTPTPAAAPSTAATPTTRADAPPSSDTPYWLVPDSGGGPPIDLRRLKTVAHSCGLTDGHTVDCVLTLDEREPKAPQFAQPGSPFSQPAKAPAAVTDPIPMTVLGEQVAARMKELFYSYGNRKTDDNRSAQVTLGPSEIGTPCDRRLAMSLLGIPAVNPGGDGWAAFKGTAIHAALAELFTWASADTGRFAVEVPLRFPSPHVPGGTTDLLDRVLFMVDDHKIQSRWSQDRLRVDGMTATQRVQLHTYGFGARLQGEVVDHVALISWPMESSSLDDMYAVIEPYDPQVARDALARVDLIAAEVQAHETERATWAGLDIAAQKLSIARQFDVADDCKFCEFFAPGDPGMTRGCNGRA